MIYMGSIGILGLPTYSRYNLFANQETRKLYKSVTLLREFGRLKCWDITEASAKPMTMTMTMLICEVICEGHQPVPWELRLLFGQGKAVQKLPFGSDSKATGILLFPWTLALPEIPQSAAKKTRQKAGISFSCNQHQSGTTNGVFRLRGVCTCHASLVEHMNRSFPSHVAKFRSSLSKSAAFFRRGAEVWIVHPGIGLSQCKTLETPEVGGLRGCLSNLWNQHYNMMCRPCVCNLLCI